MKPTKIIAYYSIILFLSLLIIIISLSVRKKMDTSAYVRFTTLPDLSVSNAASYIRHRSLSDIYTVFYISPEVRTYFPSELVYSPYVVNNE